MSYDLNEGTKIFPHEASQSLWNRAMSYDYEEAYSRRDGGLNPFGTGQCLTTVTKRRWIFTKGLNPFGTGQCLTTVKKELEIIEQRVSIPLEQGNVLRLTLTFKELSNASQSLWNRAMSYDCSGVLEPCSTRLARATSQLFPRLR